MESSEHRINFIRVLALAAFYAVHTAVYALQDRLANYPWLNPNLHDAGHSISSAMHTIVSIIVFGWIIQSVAVHLLASDPQARYWLGPFCIVLDSLWLTSLICMTRGPSSALVAAYFLIVASSTIRMDLRQVRLATICSVLGYLIALGCARWPIGLLKEVPTVTIPRYHQVILVLAIAFAGVLAGQAVRMAYTMLQAKQSKQDSLATETVT